MALRSNPWCVFLHCACNRSLINQSVWSILWCVYVWKVSFCLSWNSSGVSCFFTQWVRRLINEMFLRQGAVPDNIGAKWINLTFEGFIRELKTFHLAFHNTRNVWIHHSLHVWWITGGKTFSGAEDVRAYRKWLQVYVTDQPSRQNKVLTVNVCAKHRYLYIYMF